MCIFSFSSKAQIDNFELSSGFSTSEIYHNNGNIDAFHSYPSYKIDLSNHAGEGIYTGEDIFFRITDAYAIGDYLKIKNAKGLSNQFIPSIQRNHVTGNGPVLRLIGSIGTSNDIGLAAVIVFDSRLESDHLS